VKPSSVALPGRRVHGHRHRGPAASALDEGLIGEGLALRPLFDRLSRLLGQLAGVAILVSAGADPDRQFCHLVVVKEQLQAAHEAFAKLAQPRRLVATFRAMGQTLTLLDEMTARLERRPAAVLQDDDTFSNLTGALSAARRLLLAGSVPNLGIGLVDFAGACCALGH
jgi:hypothetical protein